MPKSFKYFTYLHEMPGFVQVIVVDVSYKCSTKQTQGIWSLKRREVILLKHRQFFWNTQPMHPERKCKIYLSIHLETLLYLASLLSCYSSILQLNHLVTVHGLP